jgi:hypothetical protein
MAGHAFLTQLRTALWQRVRTGGFAGSGATLRRVALPVIHVVNLQPSPSSHCCYINLGVHLDFLPTDGGMSVQPANLMEYDCVFRERLHPPPGPSVGWAYLEDPIEAKDGIAFAISEWERVAVPFFQSLASFPESFLRLVDDAKPDDLHPMELRKLAQLAAHLGQLHRAKHLAQIGLERAPPAATLLIAALRTIAAAN